MPLTIDFTAQMLKLNGNFRFLAIRTICIQYYVSNCRTWSHLPSLPSQMPEQPKPKESANSRQDVKPRGANRSTKVAGKLKVLPEQPETLPALGPEKRPVRPLRDHAGSSGTTGDSDEGDVEENDESQEEEVCTL